MIPWSDIACIVFIAVTANHLGLISAIEEVLGRRLPIVDCSKCLSFWSVLIFMMTASVGPDTALAVSFLASYAALWLELLEAFIDNLYMKLYEKIITADTNDTPAADSDNGHSAGSVSEL